MEYSQYSQVSPQWTKVRCTSLCHFAMFSQLTDPAPQFVSRHDQLGDLDKVGIVERRRVFGEVEATLPLKKIPADVDESSVSVKTFTVTARDGHEIPVRSYIPASAATTPANSRPLLVYLHAGGFLFGDLESGHLNCTVLAARLNISVLNVGYRLAPQWLFPHGFNDSYDAVEWAAAHAASHLNASPAAGFLVGGISSGANFAGAIAYAARDANLSPPITGLFLSIPVCILPQAYHLLPQEQRDQLLSLEQNAENPLLTKKSLSDIQDFVVIYGSPPEDKRVSFLLNDDHTSLPKRAYFQICGRDPLRDEAFLWQKLLQEYSGTKSKIDMYTGMPHGFWRFLDMQASHEWLDDLVVGVGSLFRPEGGVGETEMVVKGV
ncbi:Alpha/Beta hydrolase protein [Lasiosphaeris hirsuta]|uniref:Alpha/Beta hydrolase protein n=1 Tax=Lasiosphaeris hirsuta TaxID=260670 RepID=A0AA40AZ54_9PEZI|nr:Alpha/Beta hydrolase protein [Lasiosphaeris hirsuta]